MHSLFAAFWAQQFSWLSQYPQVVRSVCTILEILYEMSNSEILSELKMSGLGHGILKEQLHIYLVVLR